MDLCDKENHQHCLNWWPSSFKHCAPSSFFNLGPLGADEGAASFRETKEEVKVRLTTGLTAALRAAATAERWRNMVPSIGVVEVESNVIS